MPPPSRNARSYLLGLILLPVLAAAQVNATSEYLARMDSDQDGRVGPTEFLDWMSYAFDGMDRNRDGSISRSEYSDSLQ